MAHSRHSSATLPRSSQGPQDTRILSQERGSVAAQTSLESADGYYFLSCVERNPLGELWRVHDADAREYVAQILPAETDLSRAVQFLATLEHPGLARTRLMERDGRMVVLSETRQPTLRDRFRECWAKGMPGVPRAELLAYLKSAASTLDELRQQFQLHHLGLQPRSLVVFDDCAEVLGFGIVDLIGRVGGDWFQFAGPGYSAPELGQNRPTPECDQYSLALIFAEMLTGVHPLRPRKGRKGTSEPDLTLLGQEDRRVLSRGLARSPVRRFSSASELITALEQVGKRSQVKESEPLGPIITFPSVEPWPAQAGSIDAFVSDLVELATDSYSIHQFKKIRYRVEPGRMMEHHCAVRNFPGASMLKLEGFRAHWQADRLHQEENCVSFSIHLPVSFWKRLLGRRMGLEIQVQIVPTAFASAVRSEVAVLLRPFGCSRKQATEILEVWGPQILESVRTYLQVHTEQRATERIPYKRPLRVTAVTRGVELADPIDCVSKDISAEGIGFFLPEMMATPEIYINIPDVPELAAYAGLAKIVRRQPCGGGWYEIGARFARDRRE